MNIKAITVIVGSIFVLGSLAIITPIQAAVAVMNPDIDFSERAPSVVSGDNVYVVWPTDKGTPNTNMEIIFRASADGGTTFGDKINLSNSSNIDSVDQEIAAEGENVVVTWWERNATSNTPVLRISNDNGETFGPILILAANGTIGSSPEEVE
ncbi:MAG: hypothetical protein ACRD8W_13370 [Nitrososphaeraceae archaeon]